MERYTGKRWTTSSSEIEEDESSSSSDSTSGGNGRCRRSGRGGVRERERGREEGGMNWDEGPGWSKSCLPSKSISTSTSIPTSVFSGKTTGRAVGDGDLSTVDEITSVGGGVGALVVGLAEVLAPVALTAPEPDPGTDLFGGILLRVLLSSSPRLGFSLTLSRGCLEQI